MTFNREERIAFARILSDLVEADYVIESDELKAFDEIRNDKNFRISMEMLSEAKKRSFAEAVSVLQNVNDAEKRKLINEKLCEMSLSDGTCVPFEALQIISVMYALKGKGRVISIPAGGGYIDNMTVLYIENEDNTVIDRHIRDNYRSISNEFRLAGFDFVYIPHIVEDFKQIRGEYLKKVISYMIPSATESKKEKIEDDLCSMTTSRFSYELLYKKMGINMLNSKPAFLIKIGESSVADKSGVDDIERNVQSNYLLVEIDESKHKDGTIILENVEILMDEYRSMVSGMHLIKVRPIANKFIYHGFHRSLFDLIAYGKDRRDYKLVINLKNRANPVVLRPVDVKPECVDMCDEDLPIDLNTQPYTLYILMVFMSLTGKGVDWKDYAASNPIKKAILDRYNVIYKAIGKGNCNTEYRDKTHVSRIKKSLKCHETVVSNIELFLPEKVNEDNSVFYKVSIPPDLVYVIEDGKEMKMKDSEFWRKL